METHPSSSVCEAFQFFGKLILRCQQLLSLHLQKIQYFKKDSESIFIKKNKLASSVVAIASYPSLIFVILGTPPYILGLQKVRKKMCKSTTRISSRQNSANFCLAVLGVLLAHLVFWLA